MDTVDDIYTYTSEYISSDNRGITIPIYPWEITFLDKTSLKEYTILNKKSAEVNIEYIAPEFLKPLPLSA